MRCALSERYEMPDWQQFVREQFKSTADLDEALFQEFGGHLEDFYTVLRSEGCSEERAILLTKAQVQDWSEFRRQITAARREARMNDRIRQIWFPATIVFFAAYAVLAILEYIGVRWVYAGSAEPRGVTFYGPWLLTLPIVGFAAAFLSRRAGGRGRRVYFAVVFPALLICAVLLLGLTALTISQSSAAYSVTFTSVGRLLAGWVLLPSLILCLGALAESFVRKATQVC
jgi:hypothetical protein